jgi:hypothetical protein
MKPRKWVTPFILALSLFIQATVLALPPQKPGRGSNRSNNKKVDKPVKPAEEKKEGPKVDININQKPSNSSGSDKKLLFDSESTKKQAKPRLIIVVGALPDAAWTMPYTYLELEDTLTSSGRFTVLSRRQDVLNTINNEQGRAQSDRADPQQAIAIGKQLTARYVMIGNCLNISQKSGLKEKFGSMLGKKKIDVEMQMQLVDVEKGSLLESKKYIEQFEVKNYSAAAMQNNSLRRDPYATSNMSEEQKQIIDSYKQMVGKVVRDYINQTTLALPVQGLIADAEGDQVIIDIGAAAGVKTGDEMEVYIEGRTIYNAEGKPISQIIKTFAKIRVARVEQNAAWADVVQTFDGDLSKPDPKANMARIKSGQAVRLITIGSKTSKQ